ncbi:MAG: imidazoleglycerol-phosphate dehydratase HisB [Candidatus Ancillula sp.]|jgi:imidazoleglycerol-phosphate dehydratase|nr:imidazoleglycerol-phosphate dehydratase HisB [Candidatus Ancillula sp.]
MRTAKLGRNTTESSVEVEINLDGTGVADIETTVPFYNHMLNALSKHSQIDMFIRAKGDTDIDVHHTVEDVAIVLGTAVLEALGDKSGIERFANANCPLDEALTTATVDISGRPYLVHTGEPSGFEYALIGGHFTGSLVEHFFDAFCLNARICAHIDVVRGRDPHHIAESEFKAFARALGKAVRISERLNGAIASTKGVL